MTENAKRLNRALEGLLFVGASTEGEGSTGMDTEITLRPEAPLQSLLTDAELQAKLLELALHGVPGLREGLTPFAVFSSRRVEGNKGN